MLSYQHSYHAGNLADVHKHALLAEALDYMARKAKPLSYIETHAGRGIYDLHGAEAAKTGEASAGIGRVQDWFAPDHPYARAIATVRAWHGAAAYPGSPAVASALLRDEDRITLVERHPQEAAALREAVPGATVRHEDGWQAARALVPPQPRRGLMLVDPSYELAEDFDRVTGLVSTVRRKWPVGVLFVWYPILSTGAERGMVRALGRTGGGTALSEVRFPPARASHRLVGSGLFAVNPPWGWTDRARELETRFAALAGAVGRTTP